MAAYRIVSGAALGRDNNYKYAVWPNGQAEPVYRMLEPGSGYDEMGNYDVLGHGRWIYKTESELRSSGQKPSGTDAHGVPLFNAAGFEPVSDDKPASGGWSSLIPALAFGTMAGAVGGAGFGVGPLAGAGTAGTYGSALDQLIAEGYTPGTATAGPQVAQAGGALPQVNLAQVAATPTVQAGLPSLGYPGGGILDYSPSAIDAAIKASSGIGAGAVGSAVGTAAAAKTLAGSGGGDGGGPGSYTVLDNMPPKGPGAFDEAGSGTMRIDPETGLLEDKTIFGGTSENPWGTLASVASKTAVGRILQGNGTLDDWLSVGGNAAGLATGTYAANEQAKRLSDLAGQYTAMGAPSRARYEASFAPDFTMANEPGYKDALDQTAKATLHGMSANFGNPAQSPNAWAQTVQDLYSKTAYPALTGYRNQNAATGGYGAFSTAAPGVATGGIQAGRNVYEPFGAGLAEIFTPRKSLADLARELRGYG